MKRIALINPPFRAGYSRASRSPAVPRSGTLYWPHDLALTAATLAADGHEVLLRDAVAANQSPAALAGELRDWGPDLLVVAAAWPSLQHDIGVAARLKQGAPAARTLLLTLKCIPDATALPVHDAVDGWLAGMPLWALRHWLATGETADGLFWRSGRAVRPAKNAPVPDLAALPFVSTAYKKWLPLKKYFYACAPHPVVTLRTRYGCPYRCAFCAPLALTARRPVDHVLDEFAWLEKNWPSVRAVFFEDETFTVDDKWLAEWCARKKARSPKLAWAANARADLDPVWLPRLKESGCYSLTVGFESRSPRTLAALSKGVDPVTMEKFARAAADAGIRVHGCFILGWPGETARETRATIAWARQLPLDTAQFYPPMAEPGNALAGLTPQREEKARAWCAIARQAYYGRAGYWRDKARQMLTDPQSRYRLARAARRFLPALLTGR